MRKRIFALVMVLLAFFFLGSCDGANINTTSTADVTSTNDYSNDKRYNIYLLAKRSGYYGTYEEWLDSISGREVILAVSNNKLVWRYSNEDESNDRVLLDLSTIQGEKGEAGLSAFDIYKKYHPEFNGTEEDWIDSVVMPKIEIGDNGNWFINGKDTGKSSKGENGINGTNGENGTSSIVTIGENGNWFINGEDTGKPSKGADGTTPSIEIGDNGNWYINGEDTGKPSVITNTNNTNTENPTQAKTVEVDLYAFNDTHGNLKDTAGKGIGISKMTTLLNELTENKNSVLIHQGDMWQGSIESNYTYGNFGTEWLKQQGFVSMTVGNHEFDWGPEKIVENKEKFGLPILGINVVDKTTREKVDYLDSSVVVEKDGLKIGIIGAIGNCLSSISASNVPGIDFATGVELTNIVKAESTRLRNEEGCNFIVYSLHGSPSTDSDEAYDMSLSTDHYVDLVLEGHTHKRYSTLDEAGVYHIQTEGNNQSFYKIALTYDFTNSTYEVNPVVYDTNYTSQYINYATNDEVEALFKKYESYYGFAYEVYGNNETLRNNDYLKNLCSILYLNAGTEKWGKDYNILLGGGYISCRGNGLPAGEVNYAKLSELFPFNNDIVLCSVTGANLKKTAFYTGKNSNYYVTWSKDGAKLKDNIVDDEIYYLVTDTYNSDYKSNNLTVIDHLEFGGKYARDLIAEFIRNGGMDAPKSDHTGASDSPFTIKDAYEYASVATNTSARWGYYQAYVYNLDNASYKYGYVSNVVLTDETNSIFMVADKIYLHDGATAEFGFTKDNIKIGDLITFYGSSFYKNGDAKFGSSNVAVKINDDFTNDGSNSNNPLTVTQLFMNIDFNFTPTKDVYAIGTVTKNDKGALIISGKNIATEYKVNIPEGFNLDVFAQAGVGVYDEILIRFDITYKVIVLDKIVNKSGLGTIEEPKSVTDAINIAKLHQGTNANTSKAPSFYFVGKVKKAANGIGNTGDLKNVYIEDINNSKVSILIYYLSKTSDKTQKFESTADLKEGDIVIIYGAPFTYTNGTQEFSTGTYTYSINGVLTQSAE